MSDLEITEAHNIHPTHKVITIENLINVLNLERNELIRQKIFNGYQAGKIAEITNIINNITEESKKEENELKPVTLIEELE